MGEKISEIEELAKKFHDAYESLAPRYNYKTRAASAEPWSEVPENNKRLMIEVAREVLVWLRGEEDSSENRRDEGGTDS